MRQIYRTTNAPMGARAFARTYPSVFGPPRRGGEWRVGTCGRFLLFVPAGKNVLVDRAVLGLRAFIIPTSCISYPYIIFRA